MRLENSGLGTRRLILPCQGGETQHMRVVDVQLGDKMKSLELAFECERCAGIHLVIIEGHKGEIHFVLDKP